jgi:hypothetical protein
MENVACFVMFKVLYKEGLSPIIWEEIEEITEKKVSLEYRVIKASQTDLFNEGLDGETKTYAGDKWGGKYLRAPDIYWYILEKCKDYLAPLNQIADVTRGVSTGANEFFYLDQEQINHWGIEEEYLVPVIRSPRECKRFRVQDSELVSKLIYCNKPRSKLAGTNLLEYIKWGERMDFHNRPSCKTRKYWWFVGEHSIPDMIWMKAFNDKYVYPYNFSKILLGDRLYEISFFNKYETINLVYALNNSLTMMSTELNGRVALGLGALDNMTYEAGLNTVIIPTVIPSGLPLIEREIMPIQEELDQLDKQQIEEALFLSLGLTRIELDTLQEELIKLSSNRLKRAGSY